MSAPRRAVIGTTLALLPPLLGGCAAVPTVLPVMLARGSSLHFEYVAETGQVNTMNQLLHIRNDDYDAVAPVLELTALDADGEPLPTVRVTTVFGSDSGRLVVPYGENYDILRFTGGGVSQVADVRVRLRGVQTVDFPEVDTDPYTVPLDHGEEVGRNDLFTDVEICNDNDDPITVRLVYIVWEDPAPGRNQQATSAVPIGDLITVPGGDSTVVRVTGAAAEAGHEFSGIRPISVKAYFSH